MWSEESSFITYGVLNGFVGVDIMLSTIDEPNHAKAQRELNLAIQQFWTIRPAIHQVDFSQHTESSVTWGGLGFELMVE